MTERVESPRVFYVDLALGAWRPHEAATQLAAALAIDLPVAPRLETADASVLLAAHAAATRIAAAISAGAIVAVLASRFGLPFREENEWFLLFLKRRGVWITLLGDASAEISIGRSIFEVRQAVKEPAIGESAIVLSDEQRRILRFFPGLLSRDLANEAGLTIANAFLLPVGRDCLLIPPAHRDTDPREAAPDLDAMAPLETRSDGFRALAQTFCTAHFADSATLSALSETVVQAGALDLARDLAMRARQVARTVDLMAAADLRCQEIRRIAGLHTGIPSPPPPSRQAAATIRGRLDRLALEAAVAAGNLDAVRAPVALLEQRLLAGEDLSAEDLSLLNGTTDALVAAGDTDRAFARAEAVRGALDRNPDADAMVVFRNARTRAGLHLKRGEPERFRTALDTAFAATAGARGFSEIIEMNALRAAGEAEQTTAAAQTAWLRAALAWLAFEPPEALSVAAIRAVLGERGIVRSSLDIDVSESLAERMAAAWPDIEVSRNGEYSGVRAVTTPIRAGRLVGGPGAAVLWIESGESAPIYVRSRIRLVRLVEAALGSICPTVLGLGDGILLVDHDNGLDIPSTREAVLSIALRAHVVEAVFGTETIPLDPANRSRLVNRLVVQLPPAISAVDGEGDSLHLRFSRRRSDVTVSGHEAEAIAPLRERRHMPIGALAVLLGKTVVDAERLYRRLEALGILRLDVERRPEDINDRAVPEDPSVDSSRTDT